MRCSTRSLATFVLAGAVLCVVPSLAWSQSMSSGSSSFGSSGSSFGSSGSSSSGGFSLGTGSGSGSSSSNSLTSGFNLGVSTATNNTGGGRGGTSAIGSTTFLGPYYSNPLAMGMTGNTSGTTTS